MTETRSQDERFDELLAAACEGTLTRDEATELEALIQTDAAARQQYVAYITIDAALRWEHAVGATAAFRPQVEANEKAESEQRKAKEATTPYSVPGTPHSSLHAWDRYLTQHRQFIGIAAGAFFVAALLGWAALTYLPGVATNDKPSSKNAVFVAQLIQEVGARWDVAHVENPNTHEKQPIETGVKLYPGQKLVLESGLAEFKFLNGAEVILRGPAEFEVQGKAQCGLEFGNLVGRVHEERSKGFVVVTPTKWVQDIGTEFGVAVDRNRFVDVQVFAGKVRIASDAKELDAAGGLELTAGQVASFGQNGQPRTPEANTIAPFIRRMPQPLLLDLADIVAGGNGKGSGTPGHGINPATGELTLPTSSTDRPPIYADTSASSARYHTVALPLVDGVFIPAAAKAGETRSREQVSSTGIQAELPATEGTMWGYIVHSSHAPYGGTVLSNVNYATSGNTLLSMHANSAITFDLDAIRRENKQFALQKFQAHCGDASPRGGRATMTVLLDGRAMQTADISQPLVAHFFDIKIDDNDRFLTLVATDGGDTHSYDQVILGNAHFILQPSLIESTNTTSEQINTNTGDTTE